jgi:Ni/Co efflux regulator RcnB
MKTGTSRISRLAVLALSALLASTPALADKGGKHGKGQDGNSQDEDRDDRRSRGYGYGNPPPEHGYGYVTPPPERGYGHDRGPEHGYGYGYGGPPERGYHPGGPAITIHFGDSDRYIINDYYGGEFSRGHCPPGLARRHNGCMPPGQARKWHRGHPLPREVVYYPLPYDLVERLPPPPPRHRYVRVGGDVLLLSGSSVVVDAIIDIGR